VNKLSFDELRAFRQMPDEIANRLTREKKIRRKPRDPEESKLLGEIIARRVSDAERAGELTLNEGRIRFNFSGIN
jgi:hypothetical protein